AWTAPLSRRDRGQGAGDALHPPHARAETPLSGPVPPRSHLLDGGAPESRGPGAPERPLAPRAHPLALAAPLAGVEIGLGLPPLDRSSVLFPLRGAGTARGALGLHHHSDRLLHGLPLPGLLLGVPLPRRHLGRLPLDLGRVPGGAFLRPVPELGGFRPHDRRGRAGELLLPHPDSLLPPGRDAGYHSGAWRMGKAGARRLRPHRFLPRQNLTTR